MRCVHGCGPQAPKVVMGPGTGLGAAQLMWDTGMKAYKVWPGEQESEGWGRAWVCEQLQQQGSSSWSTRSERPGSRRLGRF